MSNEEEFKEKSMKLKEEMNNVQNWKEHFQFNDNEKKELVEFANKVFNTYNGKINKVINISEFNVGFDNLHSIGLIDNYKIDFSLRYLNQSCEECSVITKKDPKDYAKYLIVYLIFKLLYEADMDKECIDDMYVDIMTHYYACKYIVENIKEINSELNDTINIDLAIFNIEQSMGHKIPKFKRTSLARFYIGPLIGLWNTGEFEDKGHLKEKYNKSESNKLFHDAEKDNLLRTSLNVYAYFKDTKVICKENEIWNKDTSIFAKEMDKLAEFIETKDEKDMIPLEVDAKDGTLVMKFKY